MQSLFALTVFVGAALLFTLEPLTGRLLLPLAGGTPAVWTTCMMFFQAALLAGYAYAHALGGRLSWRMQALIHLGVVLLAVVALPVTVSTEWFAGSSHPVLTLLPLLVRMIGLPFFALAATAPLVQRWFAATVPGQDPYPLYAASNAGSLLALAAYPFLIEPAMGLSVQATAWAAGYGIYILLIAACGLAVSRSRSSVAAPKQSARPTTDPWQRWLLLSFAPSSLLMSVTTAVTTDITPIPLLWIVPLALYLLTFILAFSGRPVLPHWFTLRCAPIAGLALFVLILNPTLTNPWWAILCIHFVGFFLIALACHGELARLRPAPEHLTRYYLILSAGGVLGGVLNGLIAPVIFRKIGLAEYPLIVAVAMALLPARPRDPALKGIPESTGWWSFVYPVGVGAMVLATFIVAIWKYQYCSRVVTGITFGCALVLLYLVVDRPIRFAVGLVAVWLAGTVHVGEAGPALDFERNFFGIVKVSSEIADGSHVVLHGSTIHGRQKWDRDKGVGDNEPLSYYGKKGPIGDVFAVTVSRGKPPVAVCGLGAGSLAAYAEGQWRPWTFFEIDPAIVRIAQDTKLFTYLSHNFPGGAGLTIALGDARLEIARVPSRSYGLIVLDAFSSDSIPIHLLTRQAIEMYLDKLQPGGLMAFHVSNRYLNLKPVLAAACSELGLVSMSRVDDIPKDEQDTSGRINSDWVVLARTRDDLGPLASNPKWEWLKPPRQGFRTWTDDYSNLLSVFNFSNE